MAVGAGILIVASAAISALVVSKWNLFSPKDYEACAERAAKDAKSKDALSVLLSICGSEFKGRRKPGGGYTYYDNCQQETLDIKGPNPTPAELNDIKEQCLIYIEAQERAAESERRAQQATREARARQLQTEQDARAKQLQAEQDARAAASRRLETRKFWAMTDIHVTPSGFKCWEDFPSCEKVDMKVEVTNRSKEALSSVSVGLAFIPTKNSACPQSYAQKETLQVPLSPGETRVYTIDFLDAAFSKHPVCIKVIDVQFAGD